MYLAPLIVDSGMFSLRDIAQGNCDLCGISATSTELLEQHVLGRKHQKRLAAAPDQDLADGAAEESRRCGTCT